MTTDNNTQAAQLLAAAKAQGIKFGTVAKELGVHSYIITNWFTSRSRIPNDMLVKLKYFLAKFGILFKEPEDCKEQLQVDEEMLLAFYRKLDLKHKSMMLSLAEDFSKL